jgi:hypothetical protein
VWLPRVSSSPTFLPESRSLEAAEAGGFVVRRVVMPVTASVSWTVVGPDHLPVGPVERYLAWLTHIERSPNTVRAYAHDLKLYWSFLSARCLSWEEPSVESLGEFTAWMRSPAENVVVLVSGDPRRGRRTVNRALSAVIGFYEYHERNGQRFASSLIDYTRSAHSPANCRASWLCDPSRSISITASGRLIPLPARSLDPFAPAEVMRSSIES